LGARREALCGRGWWLSVQFQGDFERFGVKMAIFRAWEGLLFLVLRGQVRLPGSFNCWHGFGAPRRVVSASREPCPGGAFDPKRLTLWYCTSVLLDGPEPLSCPRGLAAKAPVGQTRQSEPNGGRKPPSRRILASWLALDESPGARGGASGRGSPAVGGWVR
jgi:hypothetical protein